MCTLRRTDGLRLVSGSLDNSLVVWDVLTGSPLSRLLEHSRPVTCVVWISGELVASAAAAGKQQRATADRVGRGRATGAKAARMIATASLDSTLRVWEERGTVADAKFEVVWSEDWLSSPVLAMTFNVEHRMCVRQSCCQQHDLMPAATREACVCGGGVCVFVCVGGRDDVPRFMMGGGAASHSVAQTASWSSGTATRRASGSSKSSRSRGTGSASTASRCRTTASSWHPAASAAI